MDTIVDSRDHAILMLTKLYTNFIHVEKIPHGRKAVSTARAAVRLLFPYWESVKTIKTDNGCKFSAHTEIMKGLSGKRKPNVFVYFSDSYSSWQKEVIENANKLIRKYIPQRTNFEDFSDRKILNIQKKLNRRPMEKLNFNAPKHCFFENFS